MKYLLLIIIINKNYCHHLQWICSPFEMFVTKFKNKWKKLLHYNVGFLVINFQKGQHVVIFATNSCSGTFCLCLWNVLLLTGPASTLIPRSEHDCLYNGALSRARSLTTAVHLDDFEKKFRSLEVVVGPVCKVDVSADGIQLYLEFII